jgi:NADH:ubiquinone reductase (H+-translocating)
MLRRKMRTKPRVVIVGGGFGGLAAARALKHSDARILLIDKQNHHLFQPLLYQVATAALSPADIAWPIRRILRRQQNAEVLMAEATGVDTENRQLICRNRSEPFDCLVLATGATHSYFGHDEWARHAPGLKQIVDATHIRRRILTAFECAEAVNDAELRQKFLTFVVVGGGPTGVEMAGTMSELARKALAADFRHIDLRNARVILVEAGPRLLASFPESLGAYARRALERLGVEVRLGTPVTRCDSDGVELESGRLRAATVIWAAGVAASPVAKWLGVAADRAGRTVVDADFAVPGHEEIFVIGDAAHYRHATGTALPGVAPVAKQQGAYIGKVIAARIAGRAVPTGFRYRDPGQLATIGRRAAVVDFGRVRVRGRAAWWFWGIVHIYFLISARSRLLVAIQWLWSYLTFDRGARLITPDRSSATPAARSDQD